MVTVAEPLDTMPGPAGTHEGSEQGLVLSLTLMAAMLLIVTVGQPGGMNARGKGGCATGVGTGAGGWIGAWQCGPSWIALSPTRAAGMDMAGPRVGMSG